MTKSTPMERFKSKIQIQESGCWRWTGCIMKPSAGNSRGYGLFVFNGRAQPAHRVAYQMLVGEIPEGLVLDHLCRNRWCVNPDHLEPVTVRENTFRGISWPIEVHKNGVCLKGHVLDEANSYYRADSQGVRGATRECKMCMTESRRNRRIENKMKGIARAEHAYLHVGDTVRRRTNHKRVGVIQAIYSPKEDGTQSALILWKSNHARVRYSPGRRCVVDCNDLEVIDVKGEEVQIERDYREVPTDMYFCKMCNKKYRMRGKHEIMYCPQGHTSPEQIYMKRYIYAYTTNKSRQGVA